MGLLISKEKIFSLSNRSMLIFICLLIALISLRFVWVGDSSFVGDEANLINRALEDNKNGAFTVHGLRGSKGIDYGPLAIWIYRGFLFLSNDIIVVQFLRILFVSLITMFAVVLVAYKCEFLVKSLGILAFLGPYTWLYARNLWDNSFNISFTALALAAYISFCVDKKKSWLVLTALFCTFSLMIHLMALPLIAAIFFHFLIHHRKWFLKNSLFSLLIVSFCLVLASPYIYHLIITPRVSEALQLSYKSMILPLKGPRFLSGFSFNYFLGKHWFFNGQSWGVALENWKILSLSLALAIGLTGLAYPLFFYGLYAMVKRLFDNEVYPFCSNVLLAFIFFAVMCFFGNLGNHPHYYNSIWFVFFLAIWFSVSQLWNQKFFRYIISSYYTALLLVTLGAMVIVHKNGGSRSLHYGPTLKNSIEMAEKLNFYKKNILQVKREAFHPKHYPVGIAILQKFYFPNEYYDTSGKISLLVKYRYPDREENGEISLVVYKKF